MIAQNLDYFVFLRLKGVDYRCCVVNMSKKDAVSLLNNSVLDNKRSTIVDFGSNKTPVEIIKEVLSEELILETFILVLMINCTKTHGKNVIF